MTKNKNSNPAPPPPPPPKPETEPGCTCGPWTLVMGHWARTYNPRCPVHGEDGE